MIREKILSTGGGGFIVLHKIPRCIRKSNCTSLDSNIEIHDFCDASVMAYGVASYLRTIDENGSSY